jgi:hypothetical protein
VYSIEIGAIIGAIDRNEIRLTNHALREARSDGVSIAEILTSVALGEIIEQYPGDKPYPSCLVYGKANGPLHTVWAYNEKTGRAVLITAYRPDPNLRINWRIRRSDV